ncbi:MAG TPA: hypothetical protein VE130_14830 [Nitrososphaeraceae archaeon]|jgi:hypothetical protein|nr:hypothetical protein [Nitrososphaeraceae archaeon]
MEKPEIAIWNKIVNKNISAGAKSIKIDTLSQNLVREDTDNIIDPANIGDMEDAVISETKVTDKINLAKPQSNHNDRARLLPDIT